MPTPPRHPKAALFTTIARDSLGIPTLVTRNSDRLDFHDVSVWGVRNALAAAYAAGKRSAARPKAHRKAGRVANPSRIIEVYAGAAGMVYEGTSMAKAREVYAATVADSKANRGPAAGESVALMVDGEPVKDYQGRNDR